MRLYRRFPFWCTWIIYLWTFRMTDASMNMIDALQCHVNSCLLIL
jgi:hypothetical protein